MKLHITMIPLKGIVINNFLEIVFGQTINRIMTVMEQEEVRVKNKYYWFDNNLCFEFDAEDKLVFVQVSSCDIIEVELFGVKPFEVADKELVHWLREHCNNPENEQTDISRVYDYIIKSQSVLLYRASTPYDLLELIKEAKAEGEYNEGMEEEYIRSQYFETIGIGVAGYTETLL